jgi:hypothetical protein
METVRRISTVQRGISEWCPESRQPLKALLLWCFRENIRLIWMACGHVEKLKMEKTMAKVVVKHLKEEIAG